MKDSQPIESLVGSLLKSSIGLEKKIVSLKNIVIFLKIIFFISSKIKPTIVWNFYYMLKDSPLFSFVGPS